MKLNYGYLLFRISITLNTIHFKVYLTVTKVSGNCLKCCPEKKSEKDVDLFSKERYTISEV